MIFIIAGTVVVATFLGGLFALRFQDKLHLILGFGAGAVIGVAFFDLLPEALTLIGDNLSVSFVTSTVAFGFVFFVFLDRVFIGHRFAEDNCEIEKHRSELGAGSLSLHSFLDGIAVGFAFQVSTAVGLVMTVAILTHAFSDGINTVGLILNGGGTRRKAFKWLLIDAAAPAIGVLSSFLYKPSGTILGLILAVFCGSFLYIGASELLPESHHAHPTIWTTIATILGIAVIFAAVHLAGGV